MSLGPVKKAGWAATPTIRGGTREGGGCTIDLCCMVGGRGRLGEGERGTVSDAHIHT